MQIKKTERMRLKDKDFIDSLKKLYNVLSQKNLLNKEQQEDFINDIENLEEDSDNLDQLMNKKTIDYIASPSSARCYLNIHIVDIGADLSELSKILNAIGKKQVKKQ